MSQYLNAWKESTRPVEVALSGGPALIRPNIRIETLVASGDIPLPLLSELEAVKPRKDGSVDMADIPRVMPLIQAMVMAAMVDPPVTEHGGPDSISIRDITLDDQMVIFNRVMQGVDALAGFPETDITHNGATPDGGDVRPAA